MSAAEMYSIKRRASALVAPPYHTKGRREWTKTNPGDEKTG
jgi:hypothetical protein